MELAQAAGYTSAGEPVTAAAAAEAAALPGACDRVVDMLGAQQMMYDAQRSQSISNREARGYIHTNVPLWLLSVCVPISVAVLPAAVDIFQTWLVHVALQQMLAKGLEGGHVDCT
jgi:hypothetical protein